MALKKADRAILREKFGGRCAYCGQPLGDKWHADHVEPIVRNNWGANPSATPEWPERDIVTNLNPACPPCNIDKHSLSLESWRGIIQRSNDVLRRDVSTFRRALRYGLIEMSAKPVVFYFETVSQGGDKP